MPPYIVQREFLDAATVSGLLDHALSRQPEFAPTRIRAMALDPSLRVSQSIRDIGAYRGLLKAKIFGLLPELMAQLQVSHFQPSTFETELVAHSDGAFYKRHVDTPVDRYDDIENIRVISGVYYFNAEPKTFSDGAFRLYAIGGTPDQDFTDIEPAHNSLLVFPSWAPHKVMPVHCPWGNSSIRGLP